MVLVVVMVVVVRVRVRVEVLLRPQWLLVQYSSVLMQLVGRCGVLSGRHGRTQTRTHSCTTLASTSCPRPGRKTGQPA